MRTYFFRLTSPPPSTTTCFHPSIPIAPPFQTPLRPTTPPAPRHVLAYPPPSPLPPFSRPQLPLPPQHPRARPAGRRVPGCGQRVSGRRRRGWLVRLCEGGSWGMDGWMGGGASCQAALHTPGRSGIDRRSDAIRIVGIGAEAPTRARRRQRVSAGSRGPPARHRRGRDGGGRCGKASASPSPRRGRGDGDGGHGADGGFGVACVPACRPACVDGGGRPTHPHTPLSATHPLPVRRPPVCLPLRLPIWQSPAAQLAPRPPERSGVDGLAGAVGEAAGMGGWRVMGGGVLEGAEGGLGSWLAVRGGGGGRWMREEGGDGGRTRSTGAGMADGRPRRQTHAAHSERGEKREREAGTHVSEAPRSLPCSPQRRTPWHEGGPSRPATRARRPLRPPPDHRPADRPSPRTYTPRSSGRRRSGGRAGTAHSPPCVRAHACVSARTCTVHPPPAC